MGQKSLLIQNDLIGLRYVQEEDRKLFFYLQQDIEINRYIKVPPSDAFVEKFFQTLSKPWEEEDQEYHGFVIFDLVKNTFLGLVFYRYRDKDSDVIEIGWKMHPENSGRGIATEASRLMMDYLSSNYFVHKYVAHCDAENGASERIMQKLGMQKEGLFLSNFKIGEEWRDEFAYGMVCEPAKNNH